MYTQKIFKAGNSTVVAIPKELVRNLGFKVGKKVVVAAAGEGILIKRASAGQEKSSKGGVATREFSDWLKVFMEENGEILDELAVR